MNENLPVALDAEPHLRKAKRSARTRAVIAAVCVVLVCAAAATALGMTGTFSKLFGGAATKTDQNTASNSGIYAIDRSSVPGGAYAVVPTDISGKTIKAAALALPKKDGKVVVIATHPYEAYLDSERAYIMPDSPAGEHTTANIAEYVASALALSGVDAEYLPLDITSARGSYEVAKAELDKYKAEHDVALVIDVHRAANVINGDVVRMIAERDGKTLAQTEFIVAADADGAGTAEGYAVTVCGAMNELCKNSAAVSTRNGVLNQNECDVFLTVNIGSAGNSYAEAVRGAGVFAEAVAKSIK